jgi:hypothetical protein
MSDPNPVLTVLNSISYSNGVSFSEPYFNIFTDKIVYVSEKNFQGVSEQMMIPYEQIESVDIRTGNWLQDFMHGYYLEVTTKSGKSYKVPRVLSDTAHKSKQFIEARVKGQEGTLSLKKTDVRAHIVVGAATVVLIALTLIARFAFHLFE